MDKLLLLALNNMSAVQLSTSTKARNGVDDSANAKDNKSTYENRRVTDASRFSRYGRRVTDLHNHHARDKAYHSQYDNNQDADDSVIYL